MDSPDPIPAVLIPDFVPNEKSNATYRYFGIFVLGKVGLIICANHAIRAAVAAMRVTFSRILGEGGIAGVEGTIATVAEIFALQGDEHMRELEARFLR